MREIITLSNGKRVANFSSPHPFVFTDGSILPAVDDKNAERLKVTFLEKLFPNGDVELDFDLSGEILEETRYWNEKFFNKEVDVVFCPLLMITALKASFNFYFTAMVYKCIRDTPFRCIRIEDRINKLVSINKQCI